MAVQIGSVVLDNRLLLRDTFDLPKISTAIKTTLGGQRHFSTFITGGQDCTLTTDGPNGVKYGLFTRAQLNGLAAVRDAGLPVTLIHNTDTKTVIIPSDGIQVSPITENNTKNTTNLYSGTIRLLEV